MNITVIIHTYNSQTDIAECIESATLLTDKIHVIDMQSADKTKDLARLQNATVFSIPQTHYVEPAREFGIQSAKTEWAFILDSDERITQELAQEIKHIIVSKPKDSQAITYYKVPRKNIFGRKKWLQHGGWWPDHQTRLIHLPNFKTWPKRIHATPEITGQMGFLTEPILHYFHGDIESMVEKTITFEDIESDLLFTAKRTVTTPTFFRKFLGELFRRLVKRAGFLDGEIGIIENVYQAFSKTITYLYLYEKKNSRSV